MWECSGFERDENGVVRIVWECTECGQEVYGGLEPPSIPCPTCKKQNTIHGD